MRSPRYYFFRQQRQGVKNRWYHLFTLKKILLFFTATLCRNSMKSNHVAISLLISRDAIERPCWSSVFASGKPLLPNSPNTLKKYEKHCCVPSLSSTTITYLTRQCFEYRIESLSAHRSSPAILARRVLIALSVCSSLLLGHLSMNATRG